MMKHAKQISSRCEFRVGDCIEGKYTVEKILGEGTFGVVYKVAGPDGNPYALKLFKFWEVENGIRESLLKRAEMEFETGQINSQYLVHSLCYGFVNGNPYIIMELCTGGDLLRYMERNNVDITKLACSVLYGLGDLHKRGKVHRDLKPENILTKENGDFVLTDFGISGDRNKRLTQFNFLGVPQQMFGTYAYMPPEQINPRREATVLPTTDIFSFGVMMYQIITGKLPFRALDTQNDLVNYIKSGREGRWDKSSLIETSERGWYDVISGCLIPDFKRRLQNTTEVINMLPGALPYEVSPDQNDSFVNRTIVNGLQLRVMQGEEYGKVYKLNDLLQSNLILTMGRSNDETNNTIMLKETESCYVSRKHCTLELEANSGMGMWYLRDGQWDRNAMTWKESLNGTFINSTEVTKDGMKFNQGDIISIGDVKLRVEAY